MRSAVNSGACTEKLQSASTPADPQSLAWSKIALLERAEGEALARKAARLAVAVRIGPYNYLVFKEVSFFNVRSKVFSD